MCAVLGIAFLGSASSASASNVGNCKAKLVPKGSAQGTSATLKWTCDATTRAYSIGANKKIKSYSAPQAGAATSFLTCSGSGVGFGCGVPDRAAPGTQPLGTTGWTAPVPPYPSATATPLTCGGFKRISTTPVNRNGIVGAPCTEVIAGGSLVTQSIKLAASPCSSGKDPLQLYLFVGGEPPVTSFTVGGDSTTVGEFITEPISVSLKAYKGCSSGGSSKTAKKTAVSSAGPNNFPVTCTGSIVPAQTPGDSTLSFSCSANIRAFAVYSNKPIDLPGDEALVTGPNGGGLNESATSQCSGLFPGAGYGCGTVDRQTQTASLPNGNAVSAGNQVSQKMGFEQTPCKRKGQPKPKAWLIAMGEPVVGNSAGEYTSAPQPLAISGFKCKGGKKKK